MVTKIFLLLSLAILEHGTHHSVMPQGFQNLSAALLTTKPENKFLYHCSQASFNSNFSYLSGIFFSVPLKRALKPYRIFARVLFKHFLNASYVLEFKTFFQDIFLIKNFSCSTVFIFDAFSIPTGWDFVPVCPLHVLVGPFESPLVEILKKIS